jgi:hypothetical protein
LTKIELSHDVLSLKTTTTTKTSTENRERVLKALREKKTNNLQR